MKKSFTWWTGWVVLYPFRLFVYLAVSFIAAARPEVFYGLEGTKLETNPDNWKL